MTNDDAPRPDPAPDDSDVSEDLRREIEKAASDGAPTTDERDEPAFDSGSEGMDAPPPG
ncbi:MAG: hypothetical protein ACTHLJ_13070 [Angustibacter sp.]